MNNTPSDNNSSPTSAITLAVFYGCGVGLAIISYLLRSGLVGFVFHKPYEGSVTIIDTLGYPKQQDIFWYAIGLALPLSCGMLYGYIESRLPSHSESVRRRNWWLYIACFLIQTPLIAISVWPGVLLASLHLVFLAFLPVTQKFIGGARLNEKTAPEADNSSGFRQTSIGKSNALPEYRPIEWFIPFLVLLFAAAMTHSFITMKTMSLAALAGGTVLWAVLIAVCYLLLFVFLSRSFPKRGDMVNRVTWGMIPMVILPLYQFAWGRPWIFGGMFILALLIGSALFIRHPPIKASMMAMILLPLGIGMALHFSPHYRFGKFDMVHEGQQYAFAQCIMRGMLPGVEKAVKYGPLLELTEGWAMMLFGAQMWIMRVYFMCAQVLGYWFGCLLIQEMVRRRWVVYYGWYGYLALTIAALWRPGNFNGLRAGFPILAIYFFSRRCHGGGRGWLIGSGIAGAVGAIYSVEFGLAGVMALLAGVLSRSIGGKNRLDKAVIGETLLLAAGAVIVAVPFTILYAARGGVISLVKGMYEHATAFQLGYGAFPMPNFPWLDRPELCQLGVAYFIKRLDYYLVPLLALAFGAWLIARLISRNWASEQAAHLSLLVYAAVGFRSTLGRCDFIHNLNSMAPLVVILFISLDRLMASLRPEIIQSRRITPAIVIKAITAIVLLLIPLSNSRYAVETGRRFARHHIFKDFNAIERYYSKQGLAPLHLDRAKGIWGPEKVVKEVEGVTAFIRENTARDERLHIAPMYGIYYFFADRLPLTRYCLPFDAILPQARKQVLEQLKSEKPRYIFLQPRRGMDYFYEMEHPEEIKYIMNNYSRIAAFGETVVYSRKGGL